MVSCRNYSTPGVAIDNTKWMSMGPCSNKALLKQAVGQIWPKGLCVHTSELEGHTSCLLPISFQVQSRGHLKPQASLCVLAPERKSHVSDW